MTCCAWCNEDAVTEKVVTRSLKVPVCQRHAEMIARDQAEKNAKRASRYRPFVTVNRRPPHGLGGLR